MDSYQSENLYEESYYNQMSLRQFNLWNYFSPGWFPLISIHRGFKAQFLKGCILCIVRQVETMQKVCNKVNLDHKKTLYFTRCYTTCYIHCLKCLVCCLYHLLIYQKTSQRLKNQSIHQPQLFVSKKSPLQSGEDVVAENIKCTLKVALLITHFSEVFTTQRTLVLAETDLCRAVSITEKGRTIILS